MIFAGTKTIILRAQEAAVGRIGNAVTLRETISTEIVTTTPRDQEAGRARIGKTGLGLRVDLAPVRIAGGTERGDKTLYAGHPLRVACVFCYTVPVL